MRRFSSYGPVNINIHYYVPREELIDLGCKQLMGENPEEGGHYITVWAPRQTGKTWSLLQIRNKLAKDDRFDVRIFSMEMLKTTNTENEILNFFKIKLGEALGKNFPALNSFIDIQNLFKKNFIDKPLILILDEFDSLPEEIINKFADLFRDIYLSRANQQNKPSWEKEYLLHGIALIGVRAVLGIENVKGSPFNVQRNIHIPNFTYDEVNYLFNNDSQMNSILLISSSKSRYNNKITFTIL